MTYQIPNNKVNLKVAGLFIVFNIILLTLLFIFILPKYPIGWDAPYYISHARYFLEYNVLSIRIGFISLLAILHTITGISLIKLQAFVPILTTTLLALASSLLASRTWRYYRKTLFLLSFLFIFWSQAYFALAISTTDNALGLSLAIFSLYLLSLGINNWRKAVAFFITITMLAMTHFESYLFFLGCLVFYFIFLLLLEKSFVKVIVKNWRAITVIILNIPIVYLNWADVIAKIIKGYVYKADPAGNASIPYSDVHSIQDILKYFATGLSSGTSIVLFVLGLVFIFWFFFKYKSKVAAALLGYILTCYALLLFSITRASIPINRSTLLLPVALLIGIGLACFIVYIKTRFKLSLRIVIIMTMLLALFPVPSYIQLLQRFPQSINNKTYEGLNNLNEYTKREGIGSFVIITDTTSDTRAASAYYGLWYFWVSSIFPLPSENKNICIYFGRLDNFRQGLPTIRKNNQEYNDISLSSLECVKKLPPGAPVFIIKYLYAADFAPTDLNKSVKWIGDNIIEIRFN